MIIHVLGAMAILANTSLAALPTYGNGAEVKELPRIIRVAGAAFDAPLFFEHLVARYRGLERYTDETSIVHVTRQLGEERSRRVETRIHCDVTEGRLNVRTPVSQVRRGFMRGLSLPLSFTQPETEREESEAEDGSGAAQSSYDLWLAPHLALKFAENPLGEFRAGVPEGFTATEAAPVTIDDKPMVHIELKSGDGLSGDYTAKFDLYVDPDSMLIERIEGQQRLPDGADFQTKMNIKPTHAEGREYPRPGPDGFTRPTDEPRGLESHGVTETGEEAVPDPDPVISPQQTAPGMPVG